MGKYHFNRIRVNSKRYKPDIEKTSALKTTIPYKIARNAGYKTRLELFQPTQADLINLYSQEAKLQPYSISYIELAHDQQYEDRLTAEQKLDELIKNSSFFYSKSCFVYCQDLASSYPKNKRGLSGSKTLYFQQRHLEYTAYLRPGNILREGFRIKGSSKIKQLLHIPDLGTLAGINPEAAFKGLQTKYIRQNDEEIDLEKLGRKLKGVHGSKKLKQEQIRKIKLTAKIFLDENKIQNQTQLKHVLRAKGIRW